ncbi:ARM repeat protein interacting with ABF2 [Vitis vinifera]|uniref:ARM repeat protein interacting with ABF2 n=1 Tax=Vitis vinifera TaxID=29760 RepID=A0A438KIB8_VITVI|nr:ARM repeat protein interacting with ABF2 [Vitis vinifera]
MEKVGVASARKSLKRKLEEEFEEDGRLDALSQPHALRELVREVGAHVSVLNSAISSSEADRSAAKRAVHVLTELAKNGDERLITSLFVLLESVVPALVGHLQSPPPLVEGDSSPIPFEHEVEKGCALALGLLAVKVINFAHTRASQLIVDAGALPHLVELLKRHRSGYKTRAVNSVVRRAADAITNLAHENSNIKTRVRIEGGIPPLVELLKFIDTKVQKAAAGALRTLAFKNDENKNQIVECNALPMLILMLRSEDTGVHYEAIGVIGNLVHSSPNIKKDVLFAGALQPVIELLSVILMTGPAVLESQREAALLLGQFAAADSDCKAHIVQRGAVQPLIDMLQSPDVQLREMSAFALGRLAQIRITSLYMQYEKPLSLVPCLLVVLITFRRVFDDHHNQAGIAHNGGMVPLLKLLDSRNGSLQHNAAFALYGLADNEDNVADLVRVGGVQKLQEGVFNAQPTKDCVAKTLKRLEEKIHGRVSFPLWARLLWFFSSSSFAFVARLELLLELLESTSVKHQQDASVALYKLANKATSLCVVDAAPLSPTPQVYLGEQYVNNSTLSDVTFLVEGKRFYAHRICLLASSDAFRAMFDGGYREKDAQDIEIPNIRWIYIYTGSVDVNLDIAQDLLRAADQYLLEGLKRLCEYAIAQDISVENVSLMYELSEAFNAMTLRHTCILYSPSTLQYARYIIPLVVPQYHVHSPSVLDHQFLNQIKPMVLSSDPMYITRNPQILQRSTYQAGRTSPDLVDMKLVRMVQPRF